MTSDFHCKKCGKLKLTRTGKPHKCVQPSGWQPAETVPKQGLILADFGWPWAVPAAWSELSKSWSTMSFNVGSDGSGNADDAWFETEYEKPGALRAWMPMPSLPNVKSEPRSYVAQSLR